MVQKVYDDGKKNLVPDEINENNLEQQPQKPGNSTAMTTVSNPLHTQKQQQSSATQGLETGAKNINVIKLMF